MLRASLFALALSLLMAGEARAGLIFTQTPCGGIGESPCTVVQSRRPAINAAPLTQQCVNEFYAWDLFGHTATFSYTEVRSNADYAFGYLSNSVGAFFHTYYVSGPDGLICCAADEPWALLGVTAGGLLIGTDGLYPFISTVGMAAASGLFAPPIPFSVIGRAPNDLYADSFLA